MTIQVAWLIFDFFILLAIFLILMITVQKIRNHQYLKKQGLARDYLFDKYYDSKEVKKLLTNKFFFDAYIDMETQVKIEPEIREKVILI